MELDITEDQWHAYSVERVSIQTALGHLTAVEREFIISGCTAQDWDILYPEDIDEADTEEERNF